MTVTEVERNTGWEKQGGSWYPPSPIQSHGHSERDILLDGIWDPGDIKWSARTTAAPGWAKCDGALVPTTGAYARVFQAIQFSYSPTPGVDPGGGNFYLPNVKGRTPVGQDPAQTEFDVLGETGGVKTVALSSAEMPSHSHTVNSHGHGFASAGNHSHNFNTTESPGTGNQSANHGHDYTTSNVEPPNHSHQYDRANQAVVGLTLGGSNIGVWAGTTHTATGTGGVNNSIAHTHSGTTGGINTNHSHTVNAHGHNFAADGGHGHSFVSEAPGTNTQGSGSAHNNLQPYVVFNCFVKL